MTATVASRSWRIAVALLFVLSAASWNATAKKKKPVAPVAIRTFDVAVHGEIVLVAETTGFIAYRVDPAGRPDPVGKLALPGTVRRIALEGDRAYLAVGAQGLFVVDVTDPEQMTILARHDPFGPVEHVLVREGTAYLAEDRDGMSVMDFSDPTRPRRLRRVSTRGQLRAMALDGDRLATAEGTGNARVFDVSVPSRPRRLHDLRAAAGARDVAWRNGLLLVAAGREGLLVFDPDRSTSPVARLEPRSSASAVTVHDDLALVSNGSAGLQIVDLSDPDAPREVGSLGLPDRPSIRRAVVEGNRVYLAADVGGLGVGEIADPSRPRLLHPRSRKMRVRFE